MKTRIKRGLNIGSFFKPSALIFTVILVGCGSGTGQPSNSEPAVGAALSEFQTAETSVPGQLEQPAQNSDLQAELLVEVVETEPVDVDTADWPANANGDLQHSGVFYGNPTTGEGTTNSKISIESSRRFRAQRSGGVKSVRFHNRVLSDSDIEKKCGSNGSDNQWCRCKDAGLDARSCGYATGNSYTVGNGGLISVEVRPDDGNGLPSNQVLGKTSSYVPLEEFEKTDSHYVTLELGNVVDLKIGGLYHLVFTNSNPPGNCKLAGLSTTEAAACPRDKGAQALNGIYDRSIPTTTGRWGPLQGDKGAANLYRSQSDNSWQEYEQGVAFYEIHYTDGVAVGESYHALDAMSDGEKVIGGSSLARQRFIVNDASRVVDGLWLNFGHSSGADGSGISIELKDMNGQSLGKGSIAASSHCVSERNSKCRDWGFTEFDSSISLLEGSEYTLEISASTDAKVRLSSYQPLVPQGFKDRNDWTDSRAEFSENSGSSWGEWISYKGDVRDMPVLFTIEGMPRKLP